MRIDINHPEMFSAIFESVTSNQLHHPITGITTDSRDIVEGDLYIAIKGERVDGHTFIKEVILNLVFGISVYGIVKGKEQYLSHLKQLINLKLYQYF